MNLNQMDPLAIRLEIIRMVEYLQGISDDAHEAYQPAFDALDEPATVDVFDPKEPDPHAEYLARMEMRSAELGYRLEKVA